MIHRRVRGLALLHCGVQVCLSLGLFWALYVVLFEIISPGGAADASKYPVYAALVAFAFVIYLIRTKLADEDLLHLDAYHCAQLSLRQLGYIIGPLLIYLVATKDLVISRSFLLSYVPLLFVGLFFSNRFFPSVIARRCFHGRRQQRTLVCGMSEDLARLRPWLTRKTALGMQVLGFVSVKERGEAETGPVWDTLERLESLISEHRINQVILTRTLEPADVNAISTRCEDSGSRLFVLHDIEEQIGRPLTFIRDDGLNFISLREEPLECPMNRLIKRAIDMVVALPIVILILPWTCIAVWAIHRLQSPGPLFFRQTRTGLHNEEFAILKFRTMHVDHGRESEQATEGDPRIFRFGYWLRKLSIDELPQFLNVLCGEMSIVGPRPHLFEHDLQFAKAAQFYRIRALIKPGITGLAQVRGFRGETRTEEHVRARLQSDLYYLENWSPVMDCLIIARTAWQMLRPPVSAI